MNKKTKIIFGVILGAIIVGFLLLILYNNKKPITQNSKLQIVASFYPLAFFSEQIGGDKVEVINIVPSGAEPHDYEPTAQDMVKIENSRLLILNGGGLEAWGNDIKKNLDTKKTAIVVAGEGLTTQQMSQDGEMGTDPHIWLDPLLAKIMVEHIAQGFIQVDPANTDYYNNNAQALETKLNALDMKYRQDLSVCQKKNIITSHAAFGYLAATYGLNQVAIAGLSPDAEPSPQQLADIVKFVKDNEVKYIFFESLASPKLAQTIAAEVGARILVLNPLEGLSNQEISQGKNYLTVMQDNLNNLKIALQCSK